MNYQDFAALEPGSTITMSQFSEIFENTDHCMVKASTPRGIEAVVKSAVHPGSMVNNGTRFIAIVADPVVEVCTGYDTVLYRCSDGMEYLGVPCYEDQVMEIYGLPAGGGEAVPGRLAVPDDAIHVASDGMQRCADISEVLEATRMLALTAARAHAEAPAGEGLQEAEGASRALIRRAWEAWEEDLPYGIEQDPATLGCYVVVDRLDRRPVVTDGGVALVGLYYEDALAEADSLNGIER